MSQSLTWPDLTWLIAWYSASHVPTNWWAFLFILYSWLYFCSHYLISLCHYNSFFGFCASDFLCLLSWLLDLTNRESNCKLSPNEISRLSNGNGPSLVPKICSGHRNRKNIHWENETKTVNSNCGPPINLWAFLFRGFRGWYANNT